MSWQDLWRRGEILGTQCYCTLYRLATLSDGTAYWHLGVMVLGRRTMAAARTTGEPNLNNGDARGSGSHGNTVFVAKAIHR